jgi:NAD(P)-dependent dehydrogenase (short-subunit alcohol dehydrogenase family)
MTAAPQIHGKVAVVTGAANGIGRAIALRLAGDGADIALLDIDLQGLRSLADEVEGLGRTALAVETDMLDRTVRLTSWSTM